MRAVQVSHAGGPLEVVDKSMPSPGPGEVRIAVEACGLCHSDTVAKEGYLPGISYPVVPGHEVVGIIDLLGEGVTGWTLGQRVGVGWYGGYCSQCEACRRGQFTRCQDAALTGVTRDGGYAEFMTARAEALVRIPAEFIAAHAAPLLCAGVSTFMALIRTGARPGRTVAIQGVGGLGHLAIQFAARMGYRVIAIDKGAERGPLALSLGAHQFIDAAAEDAVEILRRRGGAAAIVVVHDHAPSISAIVDGLAQDGVLMVLGVPEQSVSVHPRALLDGRVVTGSAGGTPVETEDAIDFCALCNVSPIVETIGLADVPVAFDRMKKGEARFRFVMTTAA